MFDDRALVLVSPALAGTHLATSLDYLYDLDAVQVQEHRSQGRVLGELIRRARAEDRAPYLVIGDHALPLFTPELSLRPEYRGHVAVTALEALPQRGDRLLERVAAITVYRVVSRPPERGHGVDIGDPGDDLVFDLRGFHAPEGGPDPDESFRWTGARASLRLPDFSTARLRLGGSRPAGATPPRIWIALDGERVVDAFRPPGSASDVVVHNPNAGSGESVELTIVSEVFTPQELGVSSDSRQLGVRVMGIELDAGETPVSTR